MLSSKEHMLQMDNMVKERKKIREPIEETQAQEEDKPVLSFGDNSAEATILLGTRQDQGLAGRQGKVIGQRTVYKIICKYGLNRPLRKPRKRLRWEREKPNDLWQTDWKWLKKWIIAYLDDQSRLIVGAGLFEEASTENALEVLREVVRRYGTPKQIL
ncbi:MAG: hypothetical protein ACUVTL_08965 [Thermoproteota archaeon]